MAKQAGITHVTILADNNWKNLMALEKLEQALEGAAKPVIVYDDNAYASTFLLLLHLSKSDAIGSGKVLSKYLLLSWLYT